VSCQYLFGGSGVPINIGMVSNQLVSDQIYHKIYHESCAEFEEVRELCLSEDNWLRNIYTKESLVLEQLVGYVVMYDKQTHDPVGMSGLFNDGRFPDNIGRHLYRGYLFPKYRQRSYSGLVNSFKVYNEHIIKPLNEIKQFDAYFIAMQQRRTDRATVYWRLISSAICSAIPGFTPIDGYIQTCPFNVRDCWQHYVYFENVPGTWVEWKKPFMLYVDWLELSQGE
jgi:hypothetical protein